MHNHLLYVEHRFLTFEPNLLLKVRRKILIWEENNQEDIEKLHSQISYSALRYQLGFQVPPKMLLLLHSRVLEKGCCAFCVNIQNTLYQLLQDKTPVELTSLIAISR